jgi:C1A family cysteine protease
MAGNTKEDQMSGKGYGWIAQRPDHRDRFFHLEERILKPQQLPVKHDLWPNVPPIWDQGHLGSCTAHGSLRGYMTEAMRQGLNVPMPSRLAEYFWTREIEGQTEFDAGGTVRDAIKVLATVGVAPEADWPYNIEDFAVKPPPAAYTDAKQHLGIKYQAVTVGGPGAPIRTALASGLAVVFGFSVPQSFTNGSWDAASVPLPLPSPTEGFPDGHCAALTGYDFSGADFPPYFIADNSWTPGFGGSWGGQGCTGGRFAMDYRWFDPAIGLAADAWVLQTVQ